MNDCLSNETISAMIDGTLNDQETSIAADHTDHCENCFQAVSEMRSLETALRAAGGDIRLQIDLSDIDRVIQTALMRTKGPASQDLIMEYGKKHLLKVLASVCGERLTKRSIYLASKGIGATGTGQTAESEWKNFINKLSDILADICGVSVKNAVHHLADQLLSGVA